MLAARLAAIVPESFADVLPAPFRTLAPMSIKLATITAAALTLIAACFAVLVGSVAAWIGSKFFRSKPSKPNAVETAVVACASVFPVRTISLIRVVNGETTVDDGIALKTFVEGLPVPRSVPPCATIGPPLALIANLKEPFSSVTVLGSSASRKPSRSLS